MIKLKKLLIRESIKKNSIRENTKKSIIEIINKKYPIAGNLVDGRHVLENIDNYSSIDASLYHYEILSGIREIPISDFQLTGKSYSKQEDERIEKLAKQINETNEISPLIVVVDNKGPYILEGSHRIEALFLLKAKSFPALVVVDLDIIKENLEKTDDDTFDMYHGGKKWSFKDDIPNSKKGRYERGIGIYLTTNYLTARKYAKGNRVVQLVKIYKNFTDINDVKLPLQEVLEFLNNLSGLRKRKQIIDDIVDYVNRINKGQFVPAYLINNLFVNYEIGSGSIGTELRKFFVKKGIDASLSDESGNEQWLIIFNPNIIKNFKVLPPNIPLDKYELPSIVKPVKATIKNENIKKSLLNPKFIYHGTYDGAGYFIQKNGKMKLNSSGNGEQFISFSSDINVAKYYSNMKGANHRGIILRTLKTKDFKLSNKFYKNNGYEWVTKKEIPVSELEILTIYGWMPLKKWDFIDKKIINESLIKTPNIHSNLLTIYRGESVYNKGGNFWTTNKEWARQFTQSGRDREILKSKINPSVIYKKEPLPGACHQKQFDEAELYAKSHGFKAMWVNEGKNDPPSIYVFDKTSLINL